MWVCVKPEVFVRHHWHGALTSYAHESPGTRQKSVCTSVFDFNDFSLLTVCFSNVPANLTTNMSIMCSNRYVNINETFFKSIEVGEMSLQTAAWKTKHYPGTELSCSWLCFGVLRGLCVDRSLLMLFSLLVFAFQSSNGRY